MTRQPLRAAIYSRISHDPEGLALGVARQEQDCEALITRNGWVLVGDRYRENDTPASTLTKTKRPVYERLLTDAATGQFEVIVAYSTSRLTRRPAEYDQLIALYRKHGLIITTVVSGAVDLSTADGRAMARVLAAMDCAEAERTGERISRAARQRAENGEWHGGPIPPFGYDFRRIAGKRRVVLNPAKAALVTEAAARVLAGTSLYRLADDWNARGLKTVVGKPWRPAGVRKVLHGAAIVGCSEREGTLLPGHWTPILDRPTWDAVRTLLDDPARNTRTFLQVAHRYPLTGMVFCGDCGTSMTSNIASYGPSWLCSARSNGGCGHVRIRGVDLERYVLEEIAARPAGSTGPLTGPEQFVVDLEERLHQIQDDHYDNLLDRAAFVRQTERFRQHIADARRERTAAQTPGAGGAVTVGDEEESRKWALRRSVERVQIGRHPKGTNMRPDPDWPGRRRELGLRVTIRWNSEAARQMPMPSS